MLLPVSTVHNDFGSQLCFSVCFLHLCRKLIFQSGAPRSKYVWLFSKYYEKGKIMNRVAAPDRITLSDGENDC